MANDLPAIVEPTATESAVTEPAIAKPTTMEPAAVEPAVEQPSVVIEPAATVPSVTESNVIEPAVVGSPNVEPDVADPTLTTIEADDPAILDADSAFGDAASIAASTESLNSGIFKYRQENGRTYHALKDGDYVLPNDEEEQDRLDLQNHVFLLVNKGKLYTAPIKNPARVLDIGTGTGIWAIDFADQHPESHVVGNDLSPIQPGFVPPNLEFEVDDVSAEWLHKPFDFIHARMMGGSLLSYKDMLASAYTNLTPGGWYESVEFSNKARSSLDDQAGTAGQHGLWRAPFYMQWEDGTNEACDKIGRKFDIGPDVKNWMIEVGFVNVVEKIIMVPMAPWPKDKSLKEIGLYQQSNYLSGLHAYGAALFTRVLGWNTEEFIVLCAKSAAELKDSRLQLWAPLHIVYGQKAELPMVGTT